MKSNKMIEYLTVEPKICLNLFIYSDFPLERRLDEVNYEQIETQRWRK